MDTESDVVLVKRKVDGKMAPVRMDKAKFDAAPKGTYELWDGKDAKPDAGGSAGGEADPALGGFKLKKNGKKGAGSKWLIFDKDDKQVGTEEYDTEENAKIMVGLLLGQAPAAPPAT